MCNNCVTLSHTIHLSPFAMNMTQDANETNNDEYTTGGWYGMPYYVSYYETCLPRPETALDCTATEWKSNLEQHMNDQNKSPPYPISSNNGSKRYFLYPGYLHFASTNTNFGFGDMSESFLQGLDMSIRLFEGSPTCGYTSVAGMSQAR